MGLKFLSILFLFFFYSFKSNGQFLRTPSFGSGAITESFESIPYSENNHTLSNYTFGQTNLVLPFTFNSGIVVTSPPWGFDETDLKINDFEKGPAESGLGKSIVTESDIPDGRAFFVIDQDGGHNATFTFPYLVNKVGFFVEATNYHGHPIILTVYDAFDNELGSYTMNPTELASNWKNNFLGYYSASGNIAKIRVDGDHLVLDKLTFEKKCDSNHPPVISNCPGNIIVKADAGKAGAIVTWPAMAYSDNCSGGTLQGLTYLGEHNGHHYYLSIEAWNLHNARASSIEMGGYLAAINSAEENAFITNAIQGTPHAKWIGLNDVANEGTFVWDNGDPFIYSNWESTQPDNYGGKEDYTVLLNNGHWGDIQDDRSLPFILEMPQKMDANIMRWNGLANGSFFPLGTTQMQYNVIDASGNLAECRFTVTVLDQEPPTITCPNDIVVKNEQGKCGATVTWNTPDYDDNAGGGVIANAYYIGKFNGHFYYRSSHAYPFESAKQMAEQTGGYLSIINTAEENVFILEQGLYNQQWVGFKKETDGYKWTTGEALSYANWAAGLPGNASESTPYGVLLENGTWGLSENKNQYYIIEFDQAPGSSMVQKTGPTSGSFLGEGTYTVSYEASDAAGNSSTCSFTVKVVNDVPIINSIKGPIDPIAINTPISLNVTIADNNVIKAVINWGDKSESNVEQPSINLTIHHTYAIAGVYPVNVTVTDACGQSTSSVFEYVVSYDPNSPFITGGGWINSPAGAYRTDPVLSGKANFGFESKYQKGAKVPSGNTEFKFHAGSMNFKSTDYQWLVVSGSRAQYKGSGTINGSGIYGFLLTSVDGNLNSPQTADLFRIKIWDKNIGESAIVYDNQIGDANDATMTAPLAGGSIIIHVPKDKTMSTTSLSIEKDEIRGGGLKVKVMPNPSNTYFTLVTSSNLNEPLMLRVVDGLGRVIETQRNLSTSGTIRVGQTYRPGTYYAEVFQDKEKVTVQLNKISQ